MIIRIKRFDLQDKNLWNLFNLLSFIHQQDYTDYTVCYAEREYGGICCRPFNLSTRLYGLYGWLCRTRKRWNLFNLLSFIHQQDYTDYTVCYAEREYGGICCRPFNLSTRLYGLYGWLCRTRKRWNLFNLLSFIHQQDYTDYTVLLCRTRIRWNLFNLLTF